MHDPVNSPAHYTTGNIEVIDFIEDQKLPYHLGNVVKYICRAPHKGNATEDLKKAVWYLERYIYHVDILADEPDLSFRVEVRIVSGAVHNWYTAKGARASLDMARAVAEDLRINHGQGNFPIRIMQGDKMIQLILPGDPPVAELAQS